MIKSNERIDHDGQRHNEKSLSLQRNNKIQFYLNWILDAECVIVSTTPERDVLIHLPSRDPFYRGMEDAQRVSSSSTT